MMNMVKGTKILFEIEEGGTVKMQVEGGRIAVQSAVLTIIEKIADIEGTSVSDLLKRMLRIIAVKEMMSDDITIAIKDIVAKMNERI